MRLQEVLYREVTYFTERGNVLMDAGKPAAAAELFSRAMELLPEPKSQWEAATWLNGSLGDALFAQQNYGGALQYFLDALNCPDGVANPFIQLRLGECLYEEGDLVRAEDHLMRAYMLEGRNIFASEPDKYFALIAAHV